MITEGHLCIFNTMSLITPMVLIGVESNCSTHVDVLVIGNPITSHIALGMTIVATLKLTRQLCNTYMSISKVM